MIKRICSFLLALCMALSLFPAMTPGANAANMDYVKVNTMAELSDALQRQGDVNITVTREIIQTKTKNEVGYAFITVGKGQKLLDLAGHKVELNVTGSGECAFIRVPAGAELIVSDSSAKETGKLWCDGDLEFNTRSYHIPWYVNSDVRYRHAIVVDGGSFILNSGEIEAGRAKEIYIYYGMKVNMFDQQLLNTMAFGVLAWAIGVRFDGNAYHLVNGDGLTLNSGSATINGGRVIGKGYRVMTTQFSVSDMDIVFEGERAAAINAQNGKLTLNGGVIYGMANADALNVKSDVEFELNRAFFETQLLRKIVLPSAKVDYGYGFQAMQFVADYDELAKRHGRYGDGAGRLGVPVSALSDDCFVWYDGNPVYKEQWSNRKFLYGTDDELAHTLSVSRAGVESAYSSVSLAMEAPKTVPSVALDLTMAQGMPIDGGTVKCSTRGVESVNTVWYCNSALVTGPHEVNFGGYLAKVTVTAKKGYRLTSATSFTIGGEKPVMVSAASDGSYAVVWSPAYIFECDHAYNEDWSVHYDGLCHYQQCTVCGERIVEERHTMDGGSDFGAVTTYSCTGCGYTYDKENGKVKLNGLVVDIPIALAGETIPEPKLIEEFASVARVMSWEMSDSKGKSVKPGDAYQAGEDYTFIVRAQANDGYYFAPQAKMNCAAVASGSNDVGDSAIITTFKIHAYTPTSAYVDLPTMAPGMTMGEYLGDVEGALNGSASKNIQATVSTHGQDDEVYVRKTLSGGWTLVRGASSLDAFWNTAIRPDTVYDVSFDFSTDGAYVPTEEIYYYSPASYAGYVLEGGETWYSVSAVVTSDPSTVSDIAVVSVTAPQTGATPEQDFDVLSHTALDVVKGGWNTTSAFSPQTAYTYTAVVKLRDEYSFASKVTGSVNGMPAQVKLSGDTATVTCTFPETEAAVTETQNAAAQDANNPFKDVTEKDAYYYEPILWAYSHQPQITTGTSADTFSPWMTCDRGQVVTFLWRAYGCPEPKSTENKFTDLTQDWYKKPIQWAVEQGITKGTSETTFTPAATCSVAETITFLYRAAGKPGATANPPMWYTDAMNWATGSGLVQNTSWNGVNPLVDCPRADIVTYLHRQLG